MFLRKMTSAKVVRGILLSQGARLSRSRVWVKADVRKDIRPYKMKKKSATSVLSSWDAYTYSISLWTQLRNSPEYECRLWQKARDGNLALWGEGGKCVLDAITQRQVQLECWSTPRCSFGVVQNAGIRNPNALIWSQTLTNPSCFFFYIYIVRPIQGKLTAKAPYYVFM